jgi:hypothetical protein
MRLFPERAEIVHRWLVIPWICVRRGYQAHPSLVSGGVVGFIVPLLGLLFHHLGGGHELFIHGHSGPPNTGFIGVVVSIERLLCIPFAFTMVIGWLSAVPNWDNDHVLPLILFSMGSTSLLFWMVGVFGTWTRRHGTIGTFVASGAAVLVLAGYGWTWSAGTGAVRETIIQDCIRTQASAHEDFPDVVPSTRISPDIFYCFPVAPAIIASEYCFLYGPLMGYGSQDLWLWDGTKAERVSGCLMWNH